MNPTTMSNSSTAPTAELAAIPPAVQIELTALRQELSATNARLQWLESSLPPSSLSRQLVPPNSRELQFALNLAAEVFPESQVELDIDCDPAEPDWPWYSLTIHWCGASEQAIEKQLQWHQRMSAEFPDVRDQFRLCISCHEPS